MKRIRYVLWGLAVCSLIGIVALFRYPIRDTLTKAVLVSSVIVVLVAFISLFPTRRSKLIMTCFLLIPLLAMAFAPQRSMNAGKLRAEYVRRLTSYEGVEYVWGGETHRGVDCSGLVRAAWFETLRQRGWTEKDPGSFREAFRIWWFDSSAQELGRGYSGRTQRILEATNVRTIDTSRLVAGDLAVVARGVHVMGYLGNNEWIEADPGIHRVIRIKSNDKNSWLDSSAVVVRWNILTNR